MSRISEVFEKLKKEKRKAFIPYFILGLPDLKKSVDLIVSCSEFFDILELGIPFTDPIADGPTIQLGSQAVLEKKYSLDDFFKATAEIKEKTNKPVIFMLYFNQIFGYGMKKFFEQAKISGVNGLIVPDILPETNEQYNKLAKENKIDTIFLATPLTDKKRLEKILSKTSGFLYLTSLIGITGERNDVNSELEKYVKSVNKKSKLPVCVGFGISKPEHVKNIAGFADGVIVGSAIVKKIMDKENVQNFIKTMYQEAQ